MKGWDLILVKPTRFPTLALVLECHPPLEHVHHLELQISPLQVGDQWLACDPRRRLRGAGVGSTTTAGDEEDSVSWIERFEALANLDAEDRRFIESRAHVVDLGPDQVVFAPGKKPDSFLLLLKGTVRVHQFGASGREIVLYRVSGGESCIMTTACLLSGEDYLAEGVTESPVRAVALGRADFDALIARSPVFRRFVFAKYASRVTGLMELVEDVAFERIDKRLARKLLELTEGGQGLDATHQALAVELGSAREVISRQMKQFAARGWITATRGRIEIADRNALNALADQA